MPFVNCSIAWKESRNELVRTSDRTGGGSSRVGAPASALARGTDRGDSRGRTVAAFAPQLQRALRGRVHRTGIAAGSGNDHRDPRLRSTAANDGDGRTADHERAG